MNDIDYLRRTRRITYARYVSSNQFEDAVELGRLNGLWVDGTITLIAQGVLVAPFAVERHEPEINALVRLGSCYYFVYLGYRE
jgi:hypothetical protein